jgi:hypothetical protein
MLKMTDALQCLSNPLAHCPKQKIMKKHTTPSLADQIHHHFLSFLLPATPPANLPKLLKLLLGLCPNAPVV